MDAGAARWRRCRSQLRASLTPAPTPTPARTWNGLEEDAAVTRRVIDDLDGPVVLAGHSYGGAVITEAGLHEKVAALVYITAFAPDKGESVNTLIAEPPAGAPEPPILPPEDGFLFLDRDKFPASFAGDLPAGQAAFMADSQVPWA